MDANMFEKVKSDTGFIAALDQSGGSTPKALAAYGVSDDMWTNDDEMFDLIHEMRSRIMTNSSFNGTRVLGAILFEMTMLREVEGKPTAKYLWDEKGVVPFVKIDDGLADVADDAQLMKPIADLPGRIDRAVAHDVFGTKMRSVIHGANKVGIEAVVAQQFEVGHAISVGGLVPIIEPEVDINSPTKGEAEALLRASLLEHVNALPSDEFIMLKLTLPNEANFYADLVGHPQVIKVVALSGGYSRDDANAKLAANNGMIASFSRALSEGLTYQQSDDDFTKTIDATIQSIYDASAT